MSVDPFKILVCKNDEWVSVASDELLPGDVVSVSMKKASSDDSEVILPCDMLLVAGSVVVNEAMLSGESTPLLKVACIEVHIFLNPFL